jgi:hypothetical protein
LRYQAIQTRNCVYNSSFEIWQRGTSFTSPGYTADRWYASTSGIAGRTISRVAGTGQFQYLNRIQRTAGNTNTTGVDFGQSFEIADATPYAGKTVTLSFYARKGADFAGNFTILVFSGTSSTETNRVTTAYPSGAATPLNQNPTLTTTLTRYQYSFTFGSSVTQFCILPSMSFSGTAGAADYVDFTGFQLEVGSVATDYVRQGATIQGELAACQRYYTFIGKVANGFPLMQVLANSTNQDFRNPIMFPVRMRTTPTATKYGTWAVSNCNQPGADFLSPDGFSMYLASTGAGATAIYAYPNSTDDYFDFSAEL